jgi:hypothetical protein
MYYAWSLFAWFYFRYISLTVFISIYISFLGIKTLIYKFDHKFHSVFKIFDLFCLKVENPNYIRLGHIKYIALQISNLNGTNFLFFFFVSKKSLNVSPVACPSHSVLQHFDTYTVIPDIEIRIVYFRIR